MGKYVLHMDDDYRQVIIIDKYCNGKSFGVSDLAPYTEPDLEQVRKEAYEKGKRDIYIEDIKTINALKKEVDEAYQRGYETAKHKCNIQAEKDLREVGERHYQKGLSDAWEAARKIANIPYGEEEKVFGSGGWSFIINHTASEAIEKIKQYEQKQQIQVGDEVRNIENGWIAVVSNIDGECMTLMDANGALGDGYHVNRFTKTGRHFPEIAEVLEKMRGEQDE